jgi:hypothetical protein
LLQATKIRVLQAKISSFAGLNQKTEKIRKFVAKQDRRLERQQNKKIGGGGKKEKEKKE